MWKLVHNTEKCYEVSDGGKVRNARNKYVLSPMLQGRKGNQYEAVLMCYSGAQRKAAVHRLVAEAFHGPPPAGKPLVLHKDGDRRNNRPSNLYWGDQKDNMRDARKHHQHKHKLTLRQVERVRHLRANGIPGRTLAKKFKISEQYVSDIHNGRK